MNLIELTFFSNTNILLDKAKIKIDADLMGGKKAEKTRDTFYTEIFPIKGMPFMSHLTVYETPEEIDQLAAKNKMALTGQEKVL